MGKQCHTRTQRLCQPTTRQECHQEYGTEYEPYTESECTTEYKEDCQYEWKGAGNDKVWAPIDGTCQNVPYDECKEVAKTHAKQVAYQECQDVPEQKCVYVPRQACHSEHKRFPVRVSRQEAKEVCDTPAAG